MKRFYCTICQRIIRTRNLPVNVSNVESEAPSLRLGTCNFHTRGTAWRESNREQAASRMVRK